MSDFDTPFWSYFIGLITIVSIIACAWLLSALTTRRLQKGETVETMGHVWDGDLQEFNNPLPRWWIWLFYITIVFSLIYLVLYPGMGHFAGTYGWSSKLQYEQEQAAAQKKFGPLYERFLAQDIAAVAAAPEARIMGQRLFLNNCAQCHGSDAGGSRGFPNLRDADWLYGGAPDAIKTSIMEGRNGVMPPFGPVLGEAGVNEVMHYVYSLSSRPHDAGLAAKGKERFAAVCAACHGVDGKGNQMLGAANLTDNIWLHGSHEKAVRETIANGRSNSMPAHKDILGPAKAHLLAAYVYGLSMASDKVSSAAR